MQSDLLPYRLRCEHLTDPVGIETARPRLSWALRAERRGAAQTGYQVQVASTTMALDRGPYLWDSGRVQSAHSQLVPYEGSELKSRGGAFWRVRVWDEDDTPSGWSEVARWEMGLLRPSDWTARWIYFEGAENQRPDYRPSPQLRKEFALASRPTRAMAYVSARGLYRLFVNGSRVGTDEFTPGWTEYEHRVPYQTYDVTKLVSAGENAIGLELGDGWYCGSLPYSTRTRNRGGVPPSGICQVYLEFEDGTELRVGTDESWHGRHGPILMSDRYRGEIYDARRKVEGWARPGIDTSKWLPVSMSRDPEVRLCGKQAEPVRATQEVAAVSVTNPPFPTLMGHVVDFGQNLVGRVRLRAKGSPGLEVSIRHAEMLHPDGLPYMNNLWDTTIQTDRYTFATDEVEVFEPQFTIHGFRYAEITGVADVKAEDVTAVVLHSDMPAVGHFECSNPMLNQLHSNIRWTQRSNFVEAPTDCPQRAERLGWMGDAQLFGPTSWFSYDVSGFFTKWLEDVRIAQSEAGVFPNFVPRETTDPPGTTNAGAAGWGDAGVILPWLMWELYGDRDLLAESFPSIRAWVDHVASQAAEGIYNPDFTFGDWLAVPPEMHAATPKEVFATAFYARSTDLTARAAGVLGERKLAAAYQRRFSSIRRAFQRRFLEKEGRLRGGTQTVYLLALGFGLLEPAQADAALRHLVADIEGRGNRLTTGIVGTAMLLPVLAEFGQLDLAVRLLESDGYPSWGYPIRHGATTIWERWDGWTEHGGFQTPIMNSFNHYALGSVGAFIYDRIGGLAPDPAFPAFEGVLVRPALCGTVDWARTRFESPRGQYSTSWYREGRTLRVSLEIPPGCRATVTLPGGDGPILLDGSLIESDAPVSEIDVSETGRVLVVGPGSYEFAAPVATREPEGAGALKS